MLCFIFGLVEDQHKKNCQVINNQLQKEQMSQRLQPIFHYSVVVFINVEGKLQIKINILCYGHYVFFFVSIEFA